MPKYVVVGVDEKVFENVDTSTCGFLPKAKAILCSFNVVRLQMSQAKIQGIKRANEDYTQKGWQRGMTIIVDGAYSHKDCMVGC